MLSLLHIENVAVVEKTDIEFGSGLNVLTGETGAGKSIIIDSLGAVLGGRVTRELVRAGAEKASITAVFVEAGADDWLEDNGIEAADELVLMRKLGSDGKSTCRVDGMPVSASQIRGLGENLLNIHGQQDGQKLLSEQHHLDYLDGFGNLGDEIREYRAKYREYTETRGQRDRLIMDEGEKVRRADVLQFQINELEAADIRPGEVGSLTSRRDLLKNAGKLSEAVNAAFQALHGGDSGQGALDLIGVAEENIAYAQNYSAEFKEMSESAEALKYSAEDIAEQLMDIKDRLEFSPEELDSLEERLSVLGRLMRKYGDDEAGLLELLAAYKTELDDITYSAERAEKLEKELAERRKELETAGNKLTASRAESAKRLEVRISSELEQLNMRGIRFAVDIQPKENFDGNGFDQVRFLMSANAGEKLGRISKIASGGELARIMLAMKNVLAESEHIGTMVFDEIDTGVSGVAAQRVGEKLCELAKIRQVLCVTHLPQIAAMADKHFLISKSIEGGRTFTNVTALDRRGREMEIARLTGGEHVTDLTLKSAGELLDKSEKYKNRL